MVIVAGGYGGEHWLETEILDLEAFKWNLGPPLPEGERESATFLILNYHLCSFMINSGKKIDPVAFNQIPSIEM